MKLQLRTFTKGNKTVQLFGRKGYWTTNDESMINIVSADWAGEIKELKSTGFKQTITTLEEEVATIHSSTGGTTERENKVKEVTGAKYIQYKDSQSVYFNEWIENFFKDGGNK